MGKSSNYSEYNLTPQYFLTTFVIIPVLSVFIWIGCVTYLNNVKLYCSRSDNQCKITYMNIYGFNRVKTVPLDSIVSVRRNDEHFSGRTSYRRVSHRSGHAEFSVVLDVQNNLKSGSDVVTLYKIVNPQARDSLKMNGDVENINNFLTNNRQRDYMFVHNRRSVYAPGILDTYFCAAINSYLGLIIAALIPLGKYRNPLKNFVFVGYKSRRRKKHKHKNENIPKSDFH